MKFKTRSGRGAPSPATWRIHRNASKDLLVQSVNALVGAFFGEGALQLDCLENLPAFVGAYETSAALCRDAGDAEAYFRSIQIAHLLKKLELPLFEESGRAKALEKWLEAEADCREMNQRYWDLFQHPLTHQQPELCELIERVRKEISAVLPPFPPDLCDVARFMCFGPGATLSHGFSEGNVAYKLLYPSAYKGMEEEVSWVFQNTLFSEVLRGYVFGELPLEAVQVQYFDHAVIEFVPKSIAEMRTIEVGPSLANLIQSGYDGFIRRALFQRWGIDLANQAPNRSLAWKGSVMGPVTGAPCTIDLSAASDRIPYGLVALVLPKQWAAQLTRYRAKHVRLPDGTFHTLEKFSSMGNALTFSLQTLIYGAVVRAILRARGLTGMQWRVYGDDIIVPFDIYEDVLSSLTMLGFRINENKSFSTGNFRESCGADFIHGTDVRPLYIKKLPSCCADLYNLLNRIQLTAIRAPIPARCYEPLYRLVLSSLPKSVRIFGDTLSGPDSCIWAPHEFQRGKILTRANRALAVPERIRYCVSLFNGYEPGTKPCQPVSPHLVRDWLAFGLQFQGMQGGVAIPSSLMDIAPYAPYSIPSNGDWVIRRRPRRSPRVTVPVNELRFDPMLMD